MTVSIEAFLSLFVLLLISTGVYFVSKKIKVPYSVLLVFVGLLLIPAAKLEIFSFISAFKLTPELLFFVFLPTLLFESAYNMSLRQMGKNIRSISALSVVTLLISTFFVGFALNFFSRLVDFEIPLEVALLFGALISATDPVAVLALFKEYGAPKRLAFIFEGESIFNDGTSLAVFLVIIEIIRTGFHGFSSIGAGAFTFTTMVFGGLAMGLVMGGIFSKFLQYAKNHEQIQVTLTMVMAHLTFIITEFISDYLVIGGHEIKFSPIIATTFAALTIGNYGRFKISPKVEEYMEKFWSYFAFVANSVVFLLMGLLFAGLPMEVQIFAPSIILLVIVVVMIGRAVSVYPVLGILNFLKKEERIPYSWQHLLVWGSLRGALAITMVFLIPADLSVSAWHYSFSVRDFLMALTISCIYFTIFIKATTIKSFMSVLKLNLLTDLERAEYRDSRSFLYKAALTELSDFHSKGYITDKDYGRLKSSYEDKCGVCGARSGDKDELIEKVLNTYAIGVAKHSLKNLFRYGEISGTVYKKVMIGLDILLEKAESGNPLYISVEKIPHTDWLDALATAFKKAFFLKDKDGKIKNEYMYYRTMAILSGKVVKEFSAPEFKKAIGDFYNKEKMDKVISACRILNEVAGGKMAETYRKYEQILFPLSESLAEKSLLKVEEKVLDDLYHKGMVTQKIFGILSEEIAEINSPVTNKS
ncbi:sodium:proton antiporter [Candidatus Parcubacteria bacterium]|nr:MAG: sodium:proton antiporter [Candidatus Parcubacteria bacterium]